MSWPWNELGLLGPAELPEIRRAYAQRLKTTHPEEDPKGFQRLHAAYQEASRQARQAARQAREEPRPAPEKPPRASREERDGEEAEYDYDELLKGREAPKKSEAREPEYDYDELLKGQEAPKRPPEKKEPREPEYDYDELLKGQEAPKRSPEKTESQEPEYDYDELLEEEDPAEETEEEPSPEWDYERLFAEGEAEAQTARRRKLEELRQKNRARYDEREREQRRRAADEEESWQAVMAASHALELLYSAEAPLSQWKRFLNDPVFWNVRANLDFVFALEDFLEQHPDLSREIRKALFTAYGFEKGPGAPVYRRLYRLLGVGRRDRQRMRKARSTWRNAWRSYPPWRKAVIVVCFTILAVFFAIGWTVNLRTAYQDHVQRRESRNWEARSLEWLEEDYGEPFVHPLGNQPTIFAPEAEPTLYFWALPDGERSETHPGYTTDYPHVRVMHAMKDFAKARNLGLDLRGAEGPFAGNIGDAPGAYLFDLPLQGAEDTVAALGALAEELAAQDWHRLPASGGREEPVEYQILLCHRDLAFYSTDPDERFDAEEALSLYAQAGPAFCRYILTHSGLSDGHLGAESYVLLDEGTVEISGNELFRVVGVDKQTAEARAQYLMAAGGSMLFCLPGDGLESVSHITDLYRGLSTHMEVEGVGLVMVWDQVSYG